MPDPFLFENRETPDLGIHVPVKYTHDVVFLPLDQNIK